MRLVRILIGGAQGFGVYVVLATVGDLIGFFPPYPQDWWMRIPLLWAGPIVIPILCFGEESFWDYSSYLRILVVLGHVLVVAGALRADWIYKKKLGPHSM